MNTNRKISVVVGAVFLAAVVLLALQAFSSSQVVLGSSRTLVGMGDLRRYEAPGIAPVGMGDLRAYEGQLTAVIAAAQPSIGMGDLRRFEGQRLSTSRAPAGFGDLRVFEERQQAPVGMGDLQRYDAGQ